MSILAYTGTKIKHSFNPLSKLLQKLQFKRCVTRAGFKKTKGAPAHEMIEGIINSGLVADNLHMMSTSSAAALMPACESSMYRFMDKESGGSFQQLSMNLAYEAYKQIDNISSEREKERFAFVFDDSVLEFDKAKAMELCTWTFDHNKGCSVRGYNCIQMGWCDAETYIAMGAKLLASHEDDDKSNNKPAKKACPKARNKTNLDGRSTASHIRDEAQNKNKPNIVVDWVKQALAKGLKATYCLMDSWFIYKPLLMELRKLGMHTIGMLKQDRRKYYLINNRGHYSKYMTLAQLMEYLTINSKKRRRSRRCNGAILFSVLVLALNDGETLEQGLKLRLCFVKNRNNPDDFVVIATTDLELSPEMIVRLYTRRWKIETNFRNQKSYLGLGKETISTSFDNQTNFANISCIRATLLEFKRRAAVDVRAIGELGRGIAEEIREMPLANAMLLLLQLMQSMPEVLLSKGLIARDKLKAVEEVVKTMLDSFFSEQTAYVKEFINSWKRVFQQIDEANTA